MGPRKRSDLPKVIQIIDGPLIDTGHCNTVTDSGRHVGSVS